MGSVFERAGQLTDDHDTLRHVDGVERAPFIALAELVAVAPGTDADDPTYVWVAWSVGVVERAVPGSAVWRAALHQYLLRPPTGDLTDRAVRPVIAACLERYPTLESWLSAAGSRLRGRAEAERRDAPRLPWRGVHWPW